MASLLASMPDLIQAVIPVAAWWRKYFRNALASADSGLAGLAAGLAVAGLAVTSWTTAAARAAGTAGWDVNAVVVAAVPSIAAATAVVSTNRFTPALAWILKFLRCMTAPGCCPVPDDLRLRARGCGTGTQTVAGRWQPGTSQLRPRSRGSAAARTRTSTPWHIPGRAEWRRGTQRSDQGRAGSGWPWPWPWARGMAPSGRGTRAEPDSEGSGKNRDQVGQGGGCCVGLAGGAGEGEVVVLDDGCLGGGELALGGDGELAGDGELVVHDFVPAGRVDG